MTTLFIHIVVGIPYDAEEPHFAIRAKIKTIPGEKLLLDPLI